MKELNRGCKADILALFLLCIATDTHCFVHTKSGYWTTLAETPQSHIEYIQRCNLHLNYLGKDTYVQHEIHTETVAYDVFCLPEPLKLDVQTETVTIGTCTADESETLDKLLRLGITAHTTVETTCSDSTNVKLSEGPHEVFSVHKSDIPSIPLPSTSTATTSRQLTPKAKATD